MEFLNEIVIVLKRKTGKLFAMLGVAAVLSGGACAELDRLSNDTGIGGFMVDSVFTAGLQMDEPQIADSVSTVFIPIEFGTFVKDTNIVFSAVISPHHGAQKVLNIKQDSIVFQSKDEKVSFFMVAENGEAREWFIELTEKPRSSEKEILGFFIKSHTPAGVLVSDSAYIVPNKNKVQIISPDVSFPFTVVPDSIVLSAGARLVTTVEALEFQTLDDVLELSIMAEDGTTKNWEISVILGYPIYDEINGSLSNEQLYPLNVDAASLQVNLLDTGTNRYMRSDIDSVENRITVVVKKNTTKTRSYLPDFPLDLTIRFNARQGSEILGYAIGDTLTFNTMDDVHAFYIFDRVNGIKKRWKIGLGEWQNSEAEVLDFSLLGSTPGKIEIDVENIEIESSLGQIIIPILDGTDQFPLKLKSEITVSEYATVKDFVNGVYYDFDEIGSTKNFTVVAEDGTEKPWSIRLIFAGTLNTAADVESFVVTQKTTPANKLTLNTTGIIDKAAKTITVQVTDYSDDMPLQIKADMAISYKATIAGNDITQDWITFNSVSDTHKITVRSQDEATTNEWTLRLEDLTPEKNNAAELTGFTVSNVASGYTVKQPNVDHVNRIVKISVTETGSGAFSFKAAATVSEGAKLSGTLTGTSGNQLSFDAISNSMPFDPNNYTKSFSITSEDGTNTANWTIVVSYEPQLANSDMSIWTNDKTPGGDWASANNSYVTLTTKATEGSNTYARLEAKKAPVVSTFAAGNLFLGYFQMNISQMNTPKKMTYFGIPFTAKPLSLTTDIYYTPGGSTDKGSIEIHLLHYDGPAGQFEYHTIGDEANVTVVGQGRAEFGATNGWETKTVNVVYTSDLLPTHIHVAYSTSYQGDQLVGDVGSLMYVDNVKLNY